MQPRQHFRRRAVYLWVLCVGVQFFSASCQAQEEPKLSPALPGDTAPIKDAELASRRKIGPWAIAPTPRNFPNHTPEDVQEMIDRTSKLCSGAVLIYQWSDESLVSTATTMSMLLRARNVVPIIGLSPTTLDQGRKELDCPARWRGGLLTKPSFSDETMLKGFVATAESLAQLKPPYLCLATEINLLALQRMEEFMKFVPVYKQAYRAVKKISPDTKVFVSFQYDFIRIVDNKEPNKIAEHAQIIEIFRPELDLLAITSYPADFYDRPEEMPANYYVHLNHYRAKQESVLVMEIGWPSTGQGTPKEQQAFVERLPAMLGELSPVYTAWALLHDVKLAQFGDNLASTGLLDTTGKIKPAYDVFARISQP